MKILSQEGFTAGKKQKPKSKIAWGYEGNLYRSIHHQP
jgi:hypothetical protein